jgi:Tol biopolymer transport system component
MEGAKIMKRITVTIPVPALAWKPSLFVILGVAVAILLAMDSSGGQEASAAFPGGNGKIAFWSNRTDDYEIFVMDADGANQSNLSQDASALDQHPAWSPDGTKIAFESNKDSSNAGVYVMDADGTNKVRLTFAAGSDSTPSWSPDGSKILFTSHRDGDAEIFVMDADGSNQTQWTSNVGIIDEWPAWSPDGTEIAFVSTRDGDHELFLMDANGDNESQCTSNTVQDTTPDWSPDGSKITWLQDSPGDIYSMDADCSNPVQLTSHPGEDGKPVYSPDGTKIAFWSDRDGGNHEIYVMDADGSDETRSTTSVPASDEVPSWQPLGPVQTTIQTFGRYALPKTCYSVATLSQVPLFDICDNDSGGSADTDLVCEPDGTCEDEDPALGTIRVTLAFGVYEVEQQSVAPNHTLSGTTLTCIAGCNLTAFNAPNTRPWHPWDINNDGVVRVPDISAVVQNYGNDKPIPTATPTP